MLLPYEPWHLDLMRAANAVVGECYPETLEMLGPLNLAYTVVAVGEQTTILGVAGAAPMKGREHVVEVFAITTAARDRYPRAFARSIREILAYCKRHFAKIEAACPADDERKQRFLEWLGFAPVPGSAVRWAMEGGT